VFSSTKSKNKTAEQVLPGSGEGVGELGEGRRMEAVARTMYTHVSKCKNDKIKGKKPQTNR
jgi:hypothetical protein